MSTRTSSSRDRERAWQVAVPTHSDPREPRGRTQGTVFPNPSAPAPYDLTRTFALPSLEFTVKSFGLTGLAFDEEGALLFPELHLLQHHGCGPFDEGPAASSYCNSSRWSTGST